MQNVSVKYNTKAADYYRRMLEAKVCDRECDGVAPSYLEGRYLLDGRKLDKDGNVVAGMVGGMAAGSMLVGEGVDSDDEENKDEAGAKTYIDQEAIICRSEIVQRHTNYK